jgi:hypothetical protein
VQQLAFEALAVDALAAQVLLQRGVDGRPGGIVAAVPDHAVGAGLAQQRIDDGRRATPPQDQAGAPIRQVARQRGQRMVQPPATGAANGPDPLALLVENEDGQHGPARACGHIERTIVGDPEIVPEKDEDGHVVPLRSHAGHENFRGTVA